jgi:uncharacterized membrane protein
MTFDWNLLGTGIYAQAIFFVLGLFGFWVARHIYKHKRSKDEPLVCMVGFDCHAVVHSDYSKFFGIPVEILGMLYYAIVSLFYLYFMAMQFSMPENIVSFLVLISFTAFMFSLYLISVQIFILKKGCSWCIVSAIISMCIFLLTLHAYGLGPMGEIFLK